MAPTWAELWRRVRRIALRRLQVRPRWRLLAVPAGVLGASLAGVISVWLAVTVAGLVMLAMAQTNATLDSRLSALEGSHSDLAQSYRSQVTGTLSPLLSSGNLSYLAGLSKLPSQSDTNSTLAGVLTWANNKQDNMDSHGF